MKEKISNLAESFKVNMIQFLRDIIAIPSVCGNEREVIQRMKEEMIRLGYDKVWVDPLGNLLGQIGDGKRIIAIDGHCDTVDVGNPDLWKVDPYRGVHKDGIIYGRGACDQKGGLVSAIYAGKILKEIGNLKDFSVLVVASILEENTEGLPWQYIIRESKIIPELVVITEPTRLEISLGQRGRIEAQIITKGVSCHGSMPEYGENAIYKMAPIIKDIEMLNNSLKSNSVLGKGTITISDIKSTSPSLCAVADSSTIHLDRRLTENESAQTVLNELNNLPSVKKAQAEVYIPGYNVKSYTGLEYPIEANFPIWLMDKNHWLIQKAITAYKRQFDKEPKLGVWNFSTNGVATKGIFDIPTVGFGPGNEKFAHTPDDQIEESELVEASKFYTALVLEICNYTPEN